MDRIQSFFVIYPDAVDNFHFWGALVFFAFFIAYVLVRKVVCDENCATRLRRLHFKFFIPYLLSSFAYALYVGKVNSYPLGSLLAGCFIYFSLLYVYIFSLIQLAKKSISVELLGRIQDLTPEGECTQEKLMQQYLQEKKGTEYMREHGLKQMVERGWAQEKGSSYYVTPHGRRVNDFTNSVLRILDLVRY